MAGNTELRDFVDEDDDEEDDKRQKAQDGGKGPFGWLKSQIDDIDWDEACAYQTFKVVQIKSWKLGVLYWSFVTCIVMYEVIVVFYMDGKHAAQEPGLGIVQVSAPHFKAFSEGGDIAYDEADLKFPVIDPSGVFFMTKRVTMPDQVQDVCVNADEPLHCEHPDCQGECEGDSCKVQGWCPSLGDTNVDSPPEGAETEKIVGIENAVLSLASGITFPGLSDNFFVAGSTGTTVNVFKNMTLGKLLAMASPPVALEDVLEKGALIGVAFYWNCDVTSTCEPLAVIERLDNGQGYWQKRTLRRRKDGAEVRDAMIIFGIRLLVDSSGLGRLAKMTLIVICLGAGFSLLKIAAFLTDAIIMMCMESQKKCKVTDTADYSDMQDRKDRVDEERNKIRAHAKDHGRWSGKTPEEDLGRGKSGSGAAVRFGLGTGGGGGLAQGILGSGAGGGLRPRSGAS